MLLLVNNLMCRVVSYQQSHKSCCFLSTISRVVLFLGRATAGFDGLRDLPERLLAQIVVKVVEVTDDLLILTELVVAEKYTTGGDCVNYIQSAVLV